jgi:hypothetical protein
VAALRAWTGEPASEPKAADGLPARSAGKGLLSGQVFWTLFGDRSFGDMVWFR